jgi:hypothetical protein
MTIAKDLSQPQPLHIDVSNTALYSAEQLERLRLDNPDLHLELTKDGQLVVGETDVAALQPEVSPLQKGEEMASPDTSEKNNGTELTPSEDQKSVTHQPQSSKVLNFSEMTLQERTDAIERHKKHRQEIIDGLTPEELEISDRQFEHMFKQLAESRNYNY